MRRSLNYKHLHYFWAVVRAGGVTRAAEESRGALGVSMRNAEVSVWPAWRWVWPGPKSGRAAGARA